MSDGLSDYWANRLREKMAEDEEALRLPNMDAAVDWIGKFSSVSPTPIVPRQEPAADTVKELFWKMRAERLQRELDALKHPYFWLGREAE